MGLSRRGEKPYKKDEFMDHFCYNPFQAKGGVNLIIETVIINLLKGG